MTIGIPRETCPGERRVAVAPNALPPLRKAGIEVLVEAGAGADAGFPDGVYADAGAAVVGRAEVFQADIVALVRALGNNPTGSTAQIAEMHHGQTLVAMIDPLGAPEACREAAARGITTFSMELMPRITRAQSMDVLSSQANLAGYRAVILAAMALPKLFPMMMTAAGTITPSKVFIVGAGVAGLQAIATARRLGAVVCAYDVRPAVKEQVESLGAKFVDLPLESEGAQDQGGYAKALGAEFYRRQAELMKAVIAEQDVVITTAAIPGQQAPILVTEEMVGVMRPGSVIVDIAAERGGNCALTRPGETVVRNGITIIGPLNIPSDVPFHASQLYGRNVAAFLAHAAKGGSVSTDTTDEIIAGTLVTHEGEIVHPRIRERLGLAPADATPGTPA